MLKLKKKLKKNWLTPKKSIFDFWNKNHKKIFHHIFELCKMEYLCKNETIFHCSYGAKVEYFKQNKWLKTLWHCPSVPGNHFPDFPPLPLRPHTMAPTPSWAMMATLCCVSDSNAGQEPYSSDTIFHRCTIGAQKVLYIVDFLAWPHFNFVTMYIVYVYTYSFLSLLSCNPPGATK